MHDDELISLSDVKIGISPLSGEMYLFAPDESLASNKKPCEHELMFALVKHMMHDSNGAVAVEKDIWLGRQRYKITVEEMETPDQVEEDEYNEEE